MNLDRRTFLQGLGAGALGALTGCTTATAVAPARAELPTYAAGDDAAYWRAVRALFPLLDSPIYLNTGGLGPVSRRVLEKVSTTTLRLQEHSETGHDLFRPSRETLARFLGAEPDELCFVRNATEGNSIIAAGLPLEAGDEVIFETHAHPGGSYPWLNQNTRRGVKIVLFEPDHADPEAGLARIRGLVTARTRVIQVSHVTCTTGLVFPLREIAELARSRDIWFHVDGAQAAGMIPVDLHALGCDSYALSGHKWMGGPHETGVLFLRRERLDSVALSAAGAYSGELARLPGELVLARAASRHEYGTRNAALVAGLAEAVLVQEEIGRERIAAHGRELASFIAAECGRLDGIEVLTPRHDAMRASMTTLRHARAGAGRFVDYLMKEHDLRCRPVSEQGLEAVRVSPHVFTSRSDCERVVAAVRQSTRDL